MAAHRSIVWAGTTAEIRTVGGIAVHLSQKSRAKCPATRWRDTAKPRAPGSRLQAAVMAVFSVWDRVSDCNSSTARFHRICSSPDQQCGRERPQDPHLWIDVVVGGLDQRVHDRGAPSAAVRAGEAGESRPTRQHVINGLGDAIMPGELGAFGRAATSRASRLGPAA